jgi:hypothetical protein
MKTHGPGNYDEATTILREQCQAGAVILIVFDGFLGNGVSMQFMNQQYAELAPALLESLAEQIRRDLKG